MTLRTLYLDFDSYFASVEQQAEPHLRGRPVGVVPVMADTTCCIAASYEAKRFGVKTGTMVADAKRLCPDIQLVQARHELYIEYHHRLIELVESQIPVAEVRSIDEMWCELTGSWRELEKARSIALNIKSRIADDVGEYLRCSIGIGPNRFIAKLGSAMNKPNGLKVIDHSDLPQALHGLKLRSITGVGRRMEQRMHHMGIRTVEELCATDVHHMRKLWNGIEGERMYARLRGEQVYEPPTERASVGHSHVLPPHQRKDGDALRIMHRMLQKAALRLRKLEYHAGGMQIYVRYRDIGGWSRQTQFTPTQDTAELEHVVKKLWRQRPEGEPMAVGVTLIRLVETEQSTLPLFTEQ
ncbi:MAG: hypothetical protein R3352_08745, partial [Salinisphaeraceae bacterium]|nr:hypothetical protein [Salinisphaeraceae bacterium]